MRATTICNSLLCRISSSFVTTAYTSCVIAACRSENEISSAQSTGSGAPPRSFAPHGCAGSGRSAIAATARAVPTLPLRIHDALIKGANRRHEIRLFHTERQPLPQQSALARAIPDRDTRPGGVGQEAWTQLGLDRRAPLQPARLRVGARGRAGQYRRCHDAPAAWTGRRRAADPPPDPRCGGMGDT